MPPLWDTAPAAARFDRDPFRKGGWNMLRGIIAGIAITMSIVGCTQQRTGIAAVADAMGATNLNSIEYSGSGELFGFGQAYIPGERWPRFIQRSYNVAVNYQTPAMRMNTVRSQGEFPPRGGAAQPVGADQRTIQVVSGKYAWTKVAPSPIRIRTRLPIACDNCGRRRMAWLKRRWLTMGSLKATSSRSSSTGARSRRRSTIRTWSRK